jgi:hypothetical protein
MPLSLIPRKDIFRVARVRIHAETRKGMLRYGRPYFPITPCRLTAMKRVRTAARTIIKERISPGEKYIPRQSPTSKLLKPYIPLLITRLSKPITTPVRFVTITDISPAIPAYTSANETINSNTANTLLSEKKICE